MLELVMRWWHGFSLKHFLEKCVLASWCLILLVGPLVVDAQESPAKGSGAAQISKAVGVIKNVDTQSITVVAETGGEVNAKLTNATKILRVPPGEKDLKNATALQPQDLQPGDRVLVRGQASSDGRVINALAVIVMKESDVAEKQQHDRDDWQKRGVGGLVTNLDATAGNIIIASNGIGATRNITVRVSKNTVLRRYALDSVRFDDAKAAPIDQIKTGDQLRARGIRNADGSEVSAEEVVSGSFRNIAGTIGSIDAAANTITVQDLISKNAVVVRVTADSQIKKLPAEMAQRIALRLKGTGGSSDQPAGQGGEQRQISKSGDGKAATVGDAQIPDSGSARRGPGGAVGGNGAPDLQRMLARLPNSKLSDLQKGDAVMIVSTAGGASEAVTAITLLAGVDAILTAAPNRSASSLLSPWSLNTGGAEGEAAQ